MIQLDGPPRRWVPRHGRPAPCLDRSDGLPAYESDLGALLIMETLFAFDRRTVYLIGSIGSVSDPILLPRSYMAAAVRDVLAGGEGLCALHDDPDAVWSWRPLLYHVTPDGVRRFGSQEELGWRQGLAETQVRKAELWDELANHALECHRAGVPFEEAVESGAAIMDAWNADPPGLPMTEATVRAEAILREHLCPQQLLDLEASGSFVVRGTVNKAYRVRLGNGCEIVSPETHRPFVSMCIHPETWMPDADVALATKLLIESGPDGENELLAGARTTAMPPPRRASFRWERHARDLERALIPAPYLAEAA